MHTELDRGKAIMLSRPGIFGVEASTLKMEYPKTAHEISQFMMKTLFEANERRNSTRSSDFEWKLDTSNSISHGYKAFITDRLQSKKSLELHYEFNPLRESSGSLVVRGDINESQIEVLMLSNQLLSHHLRAFLMEIDTRLDLIESSSVKLVDEIRSTILFKREMATGFAGKGTGDWSAVSNLKNAYINEIGILEFDLLVDFSLKDKHEVSLSYRLSVEEENLNVFVKSVSTNEYAPIIPSTSNTFFNNKLTKDHYIKLAQEMMPLAVSKFNHEIHSHLGSVKEAKNMLNREIISIERACESLKMEQPRSAGLSR